MKVVLLEELGVSQDIIEKHAKKLEAMGHTFEAFPKDTDPKVQAQRSRDADVIMLANMPLDKSVIDTAANLKFIDIAFTGVDHVPVAEAKAKGIAVSNASGYATQAVAELWGFSRSVPVMTVPFCSISSRFTRSQLCICWA